MDAETLIAGRFVIERVAATGGMGVVYRALDRFEGAAVALKILSAHSEIDVERFEREAALLAQLSHPAIVRYVAHGVTVAGAHYLAMEWLDGEDLATRLERKPVTIAEAVAVARRAAEALA